MPRDGTGNYSQPFPEVEEDTTIESAVYNGFTADVALDLNAPRPILAGGTAATNARDALINLNGEQAKQNVINYDSHPWVSGSFYSTVSATGAPVNGHVFIGTCAMIDDSNIVITARDESTALAPGKVYVREKKNGTWGAWIAESVDKVDIGGAVMTGPLVINADNPFLLLDKKASGQSAYVAGALNSKNRWTVVYGDAVTESATDGVGSNFVVYRHNNAGTPVDSPIHINRQTGTVLINGQEKVSRAGDAMSGNLHVPEPTAPTHAVTKNYVDKGVRNIIIQTAGHRYLTAADAGSVIGMSHAVGGYFIVQRQVNAPMVYGMQFDLINWGCPDCRVWPADGQVLIYSEDQRFRLRTNWATATLLYLGGESWMVSGSLIP